MKEYDVAADLKIYVDDKSKLDSVKSSIEKIAKVQRFAEEDVGFGIKVLRATLLLADSDGGMDKLEEQIKQIGEAEDHYTNQQFGQEDTLSTSPPPSPTPSPRPGKPEYEYVGATPAGNPGKEIGRASCRERVCQYV